MAAAATRGGSKPAWIVSGILALLFIASGATKLAGLAPHPEQFAHWGYPIWFMYVVGAWEVGGAVGLMVSPMAYFAALFLGVDMAGAVITNIRAGDGARMAFPLALLLLLAYVAYARRGARSRAMA